jgi:PTS system mannose-specific IIC component
MIDQVPDTVIAGFTASGNLLPAIGMAMLLKMLWDKKLAVYFLLGFILVSYLSLDMVGVAAFAFVIVVVAVLRDKQNLDLQHKFKSKALPISSSKDDDEEAFFA